MGRILTVGPNQAVVVTKRREKKVSSGTWAFVFTNFTDVQYMSLALMTLTPQCVNVETAEGVPVCVSAVAQCKIINKHEYLLIAAEQFLGMLPKKIGAAITLTLEGHLRAILGTLTVEEIYKDRIKFAHLVREVAAVDIANMGIEIVSFVIKDVDDEVGYLSSLGKARTAAVKRDASIGVAYADRDAGIREAECERAANEVRFQTKTNIENFTMKFHMKKSEYEKEINTAKAEAHLAYSLRIAQIEQELRREELAIEVIERKKNIEIEKQETRRKELELMATVKLPSEAESYRIQTIAEGEKMAIIERANGESLGVKKISEAQAYKTLRTGLSEADIMLRRALILKNYNDAAVKHLIIKSLPEIASKISAPLAKIEEIVLLCGMNSNIVGAMATLAAQVPPILQALDMGHLKKKIQKDTELK